MDAWNFGDTLGLHSCVSVVVWRFTEFPVAELKSSYKLVPSLDVDLKCGLCVLARPGNVCPVAKPA